MMDKPYLEAKLLMTLITTLEAIVEERDKETCQQIERWPLHYRSKIRSIQSKESFSNEQCPIEETKVPTRRCPNEIYIVVMLMVNKMSGNSGDSLIDHVSLLTFEQLMFSWASSSEQGIAPIRPALSHDNSAVCAHEKSTDENKRYNNGLLFYRHICLSLALI
jgi:hypothetical protein